MWLLPVSLPISGASASPMSLLSVFAFLTIHAPERAFIGSYLELKIKKYLFIPIHSICYDSLTLVRWGMALIIHSFRKYSQLSFRRGFFIYRERETTHLAFYTSTPIDLCSGLSVSCALSSFAQATGTQPILNSALEALSVPSLA